MSIAKKSLLKFKYYLGTNDGGKTLEKIKFEKHPISTFILIGVQKYVWDYITIKNNIIHKIKNNPPLSNTSPLSYEEKNFYEKYNQKNYLIILSDEDYLQFFKESKGKLYGFGDDKQKINTTEVKIYFGSSNFVYCQIQPLSRGDNEINYYANGLDKKDENIVLDTENKNIIYIKDIKQLKLNN